MSAPGEAGTGRSWLARSLDRKERLHPDRIVHEHRRRLLAGVAGRVLELACGDGANFEHYPAHGVHVVAVEPDPLARAAARVRAEEVRAPVELLDASAESLPLEDRSVDVGVCFWALCSVGSQPAALAELRRVLRPDGQLRLYEHVRSRRPSLARVQEAVDAAGWPRLLSGCHTSRDTEASVRAAGFEVVWLRRFFHASSLLTVPAGPQIVALARPR